MGLRGVNDTQATGNHDRLVVAALLLLRQPGSALCEQPVMQTLLVFPEIAEQIRTAELVVEGGTAERAVQHDLQGAANVLWLAVGQWAGGLIPVDPGHRKAGQTGFGARAAARGAFVAYLATGTRSGSRERRDRGRVIVRLHLHQDMVRRALALIAVGANMPGRGEPGVGRKAFDLCALHDRSVVRIGDQHMLGMGLVRMADHAEHAARLRHTVDREISIEYLVSAMFAVGLRKHH